MTPLEWVEDEMRHHTGKPGSFQWRSFFIGFQIGRLPQPLTEPAVRACVSHYLRALGHRRRKDPA